MQIAWKWETTGALDGLESCFFLLEARDPSAGGGVCPVAVTELYEYWLSGFLCIW